MTAPGGEIRKFGIGASEAAAVLGLSRYTTPLDIYIRKTTEGVSWPETQATRMGILLEPIVLDLYESDPEGGKVERNLPTVPSVDIPFMFASLDARRADTGYPVEAKTVGVRTMHEWGEPGTDQIPQEYLVQVTHQMIVTKAQSADIAVLKGGQEFGIYHVAYDDELGQMVIEGLRQFWMRVEKREPPEPQTADEVGRLYRRSREAAIEATPAIVDAVCALLALRKQLKPLTKQEEELETQLKKFLTDRDTITINGEVAATWRSAKESLRFDTKAFQHENAELYAKFLKPVAGARRFLLKEI